MFTGASPKLTFIFGLIAGVTVVSIVGMFLLAGKVGRTSGNASVTAENTAPSATGSPTQPAGNVKPVGKDDHVRGAKNPKVYLVEYSDFECPFCKNFHPTMQQVLQEYGDDIAWVYRHYPLSFHANAPKEAEASECANELGGADAFWKYADKIFERTTANGTGFALDKLVPLAKEIGLNEGKFKSCLDSGKFKAHVDQDFSEGTTAGVNGTPATFVVKSDGSSQLISGALPYAQVKQVIDQALQ